LIDKAPGLLKSGIVLVVLVPDQVFIESSKVRKHLFGPASEVDGIDWTFVIRVVRSATSATQARLKRCTDCGSDITISARHPRAADIAGMGIGEHVKAGLHV